jgi:hypothetical protein
MSLELHIPPCLNTPPHPRHTPPHEKPLRINVSGPLSSVEKLLPNIPWKVDTFHQQDFQPAAVELARLTYRTLYGREPQSEIDGDLVVRDELLGWVNPERPK